MILLLYYLNKFVREIQDAVERLKPTPKPQRPTPKWTLVDHPIAKQNQLNDEDTLMMGLVRPHTLTPEECAEIRRGANGDGAA